MCHYKLECQAVTLPITQYPLRVTHAVIALTIFCHNFWMNFKFYYFFVERPSSKLRQLGSLNWIVDDSKSDFNKFGRRFYNDLDLKVKMESYFLILIKFYKNWLNSISFQSNSWLKDQKSWLKDQKKSLNLIEKLIWFDFSNLFWSLSIYFWSVLIHFKLCELFNLIWTWINLFFHDNADFYDKFR